MKVRDLLKVLRQEGWELARIKGSHRQFKHPKSALVVTVAGKLGKDVPTGTLARILRQTGIKR